MAMQLFKSWSGQTLKKYTPPRDIRKLKELTGQFAVDKNIREYPLEDGGISVVRNLMKRDGVAVVDAGIPKGGIFPRHDHVAYEWLIVYEGVAKVFLGEEDYLVGPDEKMKYVILPPGVPHRVEAVQKVRLIGITVPADEGYPGADRK